MKHTYVTQRILGPLVAGGILSVLAMPAGAVDLTSPDGNWTFSVNGNINVDYILFGLPEKSGSHRRRPHVRGAANGNTSVSNVGNGLLPAAIVFGVKTTQDGFDIGVHFGFYPGIATNDGGSPNLQASGGPTNTALGTTGLDIRQVYLTFGNKDMGTFLLGRQIGLFGADVILNDMTLPGVGAPGSAATSAPSNTTLGGIGFGYIYTDWLAQMDYTTPDFAGFNITGGIFDPLELPHRCGCAAAEEVAGLSRQGDLYELLLGYREAVWLRRLPDAAAVQPDPRGRAHLAGQLQLHRRWC